MRPDTACDWTQANCIFVCDDIWYPKIVQRCVIKILSTHKRFYERRQRRVEEIRQLRQEGVDDYRIETPGELGEAPLRTQSRGAVGEIGRRFDEL